MAQDDSRASLHLKAIFYSGVRKTFSRRTIKAVTFDDQLVLLEALPPFLGEEEDGKSLHYIILNEMLSPALAAERWEALDKSSIIKIVERCMEMNKCRDLNNKLRGCLLHIKTPNFGLDDFHNMFNLLSDSGLSNK